MKINRFRSKQLNGYLDFDLAFRDEVSFLIGINGSGKTSVLKATIALLTPDIDWLMTSKYEALEINLNHDDKEISIYSCRTNEGIEFKVKDSKNTSTDKITEQTYKASLRLNEEFLRDDDGEIVRVRENRSDLAETITSFRAVRLLPTPIFLGLDRTTLPVRGRPFQKNRLIGSIRRPTPTVRAFLDESVAQAEEIATGAMRSANLLRSRRASELRDEILFTLFSESNTLGDALLPTQKDILRYAKASLKSAFKVIGLDTQRTDIVIDPFFQEITELASKLVQPGMIDKIGKKASEEINKTFYAWIALNPRLALIGKVESLVKRFSDQENEIFKNTRKYLEIMNSFFGDSNKNLSFNEDSTVSVVLKSGSTVDVSYLSSGERQLFVLITNLMFSNDERRANAVIIDEPELSLHIKWQEMFVEALLDANPKIQLILATHSPSIILDRHDACVDLS